jgi:hypothetical protein
MKIRLALLSLLFLAIITVGCSTNPAPSTPSASPAISGAAADPLPSWNDGPAKQAIVDFVKTTTDRSNPKFVAPEDRIATFDQNGTTWVEQPTKGGASRASAIDGRSRSCTQKRVIS